MDAPKLISRLISRLIARPSRLCVVLGTALVALDAHAQVMPIVSNSRLLAAQTSLDADNNRFSLCSLDGMICDEQASDGDVLPNSVSEESEATERPEELATTEELEHDDTSVSDEESVLEKDEANTLFGERLHRAGPITAEFIYIGQVYNNAHGGISTKNATRYRGNLDVLLSIDTEDAEWWEGGQFFMYLQQSHGQTLSSEFVGDSQFYSNIDSSPKNADLTQLGEYWYQHSFAEDLLSVRLGRQEPNADFAYADLGGDFVNSSFLTLPNIPLPTWPTQTLGVSSLFQVNEKLRLGGGVYDQGRDIGQFWSTFTSRGMFLISQADYQPFVNIEDSKLTIIRVGSWYCSGDTAGLDGARDFNENYGVYTTLDRKLFSECSDAEQGLGSFFQYSWAPSDRNQLNTNYGAGLVYRGLIPDRDVDTMGLGFSLVEFSSFVTDSTGQTSENAIELFYRAQVREWLQIQPDLQYIARPNGIEKDALLVGLNFEVAF